jgi:hypothetical protein
VFVSAAIGCVYFLSNFLDSIVHKLYRQVKYVNSADYGLGMLGVESLLLQRIVCACGFVVV